MDKFQRGDIVIFNKNKYRVVGVGHGYGGESKIRYDLRSIDGSRNNINHVPEYMLELFDEDGEVEWYNSKNESRDPFGRPIINPIEDDWEQIPNEEKVIKYFTTYYGNNFFLETIEPNVFDEFCDFNKIDKNEALKYIENYISERRMKKLKFQIGDIVDYMGLGKFKIIGIQDAGFKIYYRIKDVKSKKRRNYIGECDLTLIEREDGEVEWYNSKNESSSYEDFELGDIVEVIGSETYGGWEIVEIKDSRFSIKNIKTPDLKILRGPREIKLISKNDKYDDEIEWYNSKNENLSDEFEVGDIVKLKTQRDKNIKWEIISSRPDERCGNRINYTIKNRHRVIAGYFKEDLYLVNEKEPVEWYSSKNNENKHMKDFKTYIQYNEGLFGSDFGSEYSSIINKLYDYASKINLNDIREENRDADYSFIFSINKKNNSLSEEDPYGEEDWGDTVKVTNIVDFETNFYRLKINDSILPVKNREAKKLYKIIKRRFKENKKRK